MSQIYRPLSDQEYRALSGLLLAERGAYVFDLAAPLARLCRTGLCTADGLVTAAGREVHAAERARRALTKAGPLPSQALQQAPPDEHFRIAS